MDLLDRTQKAEPLITGICSSCAHHRIDHDDQDYPKLTFCHLCPCKEYINEVDEDSAELGDADSVKIQSNIEA